MSQMKLGTKIATGFGLLLAIAMVLGGLAVWNMRAVGSESAELADEFAPEVNVATDVERNTLQTMYAIRGYAYTEKDDYLKEGEAEIAEVKKHLNEAMALAERSPHLVKLKTAAPEAQKAVEEYERLIRETAAKNQALSKLRTGMLDAANRYMKNCADFLASQNEAMEKEIVEGADPAKLKERLAKITIVNDIIEIGNAARIGNYKAQATRDPELLKATIANLGEVGKDLAKLKAVTQLDVNLRQIDETANAGSQYKSHMEQFLTEWLSLERLNDLRRDTGNQIIANARNMSDDGIHETLRISQEANNDLSLAATVMIAGLIAALIIGSALAFFITRSITKPINRVIEGLTEGAEQVASAAGQVSAASQSLAQGASEQASSIEETSASLEEMSSMTQQNAGNAGQADNLMQDAKQVIGRANGSMQQMTVAMDSISKASVETSKIIKTIDEIAFQTNLLALNAAVEAARAGEAGAGFAVVADEVRNLAMRAAEAAKNTASLIEGTVKQVQDGTELVSSTNEAFGEVETSAAKVADLLAEIATASKEQAQGIGQVNTAVVEMDKVTQQNAANAEESASASEEMNAQAEQMKSYVEELAALVGGSGSGHAAAPRAGAVHRLGGTARAKIPGPAAKTLARTKPAAPVASRGREVSAAEMIPLEDEEFKDF